VLLRMERLGLVAGQDFDLARPTRPCSGPWRAPRPTPSAHSSSARPLALRAKRNGWNLAVARMIGTYGEDYLLRAFIAYAGLGALPPEEAFYPAASPTRTASPH
jgi:hypothetical protein